MKTKIKKYSQINGVSGQENLVRKELEKTFGKGVISDNLGSIAKEIKGVKAKKKIGIFAHMDEVGFLVCQIKDNGIVKVVNVGGVSASSLILQRVKFTANSNKKLTGIVNGVYEKKISELKVSDLEINFGFSSKEDAKDKGLKVGSYIYFTGEFEELENDTIVCKAADNRIGCAIVEKLYEEFKDKENNFDLILGATVQEEVGLKGASTLLNCIGELDHIIIVDVSPVDLNEDNELGKGFLLRIGEPRGYYDYKGNLEFKELAIKNDITYQEFFSKGRTDGAMMQITNIGNRVNAICIPALNLHTPNTIFNMKDVNSGLEIIKRFLYEI